jgi:hypothetical protein
LLKLEKIWLPQKLLIKRIKQILVISIFTFSKTRDGSKDFGLVEWANDFFLPGWIALKIKQSDFLLFETFF